jgi:hypothetical protein
MEAESTQLVLDLALELVVARGGRVAIGGVLIKIVKGVEEGMLMSLGLLEVLLLKRLLVESSIGLVLAGGVLALVLTLGSIVLAGGVLVLLGAVDDKVVGVSIAEASILRTTTAPVVQAVVVKPREPIDDQS